MNFQKLQKQKRQSNSLRSANPEASHQDKIRFLSAEGNLRGSKNKRVYSEDIRKEVRIRHPPPKGASICTTQTSFDMVIRHRLTHVQFSSLRRGGRGAQVFACPPTKKTFPNIDVPGFKFSFQDCAIFPLESRFCLFSSLRRGAEFGAM